MAACDLTTLLPAAECINCAPEHTRYALLVYFLALHNSAVNPTSPSTANTILAAAKNFETVPNGDLMGVQAWIEANAAVAAGASLTPSATNANIVAANAFVQQPTKALRAMELYLRCRLLNG